ncbi:class I SAM-dependent methyltransferase, partial [Acinetobacter baumannii]
GDGELVKADLFHVDGDHSIQGTYHDLILARDQLADGGVILLDDIDTKECPGVKAAMLLFLGDNPEYTWDHFPSYRGLAAIYKA